MIHLLSQPVKQLVGGVLLAFSKLEKLVCLQFLCS